MKSLVIILTSCLLTTFSYAATIGDVVYELPKNHEWIFESHGEQDSKTSESSVIYFPKNVKKNEAQETFGVNKSHLQLKIEQISPIIVKALRQMLPKMYIKFMILEKSSDNLVYEWIGTENDVEKIHGLGRGFSNKDGTVILEYTTQNIPDVDKAREIWFPVLKAAHLK